MNTVIGIDPGLSKCAFAVVKSNSTILDFGIIKTDASVDGSTAASIDESIDESTYESQPMNQSERVSGKPAANHP